MASVRGTRTRRRRVMSQERLKHRVDLRGGYRADRSEADDSLAVDDEDPRFGLELPDLERGRAGLEGGRRRIVVRSGQELLDVDEVGCIGAVLLEHKDLLVRNRAAQPALAEKRRGETRDGGVAVPQGLVA